jgi:hypothetical protein
MVIDVKATLEIVVRRYFRPVKQHLFYPGKVHHQRIDLDPEIWDYVLCFSIQFLSCNRRLLETLHSF